MWMFAPRWRLASALAVLAFIAPACGNGGFGREDAIVSLQTTGVTEAEATCMADTLIALEGLDAADPRRSLTDTTREALVSASTRCIRPQVLRASESAAVASASQPAVSSHDSWAEATPTAAGPSETVDERRSTAVRVLMQFGRSFENATCVVDHLLAVDADAVFEDPNFGMGMDPFEAQAFASCI